MRYSIEFTFDCDVPIKIRILYFATEVPDPLLGITFDCGLFAFETVGGIPMVAPGMHVSIAIWPPQNSTTTWARGRSSASPSTLLPPPDSSPTWFHCLPRSLLSKF